MTRHIDFSDVSLSAAIESACYRIAQESLTNVAKHAEARHVDLRVFVEGATLIIEIEDDGRGFVSTERGDGRGLTGMRERTELLGGSLLVTSRPGEGTTLRAELPLTPPSSRADDGAARGGAEVR